MESYPNTCCSLKPTEPCALNSRSPRQAHERTTLGHRLALPHPALWWAHLTDISYRWEGLQEPHCPQ